MWWNVIVEALTDTLWLFPFLLLLYILIELMEHNTRLGKPFKALSGKCAPLIGSAAGLVPMCGFSVMAAKLYRHRHITLGALFAVLISTSDEGLLVLLLSTAEGFGWAEKGIAIGLLCGVKLLLGILIGYAIDLVCARKHPVAPLPSPSEHHDHEHGHDHDREDEEDHEHGNCECNELSVCEHKKVSTLRLYLLSPLLHALEVAAFVLLANLVFGFLVYGIGEDRLVAFLQADGFYWAQPAVSVLVGLIPNCASSVLLAETYALGGIGFGGLLAGLTVNAGLGYLALFRGKKELGRAFAIVGAMCILGLAAGYAANAIFLLI